MAQASSPGSSRPRPKAENDVYTALMVVSFLCVLSATIYVGVRAYTLFGSLLPPAGGS